MVLQLIQGVFSTTETEGTGYFKLVDISSDQIVFDGVNYAYDVNTGELVWMDDTYAGLSFSQNAPVLVATYEVAANTPAGDYTLVFANEVIADGDWNEYYDSFSFTVAVTIASTEPACEHEYFYACDQICMKCGELTNPDATHSMIHVEAKRADCVNDGNIEYWYCEYCGLHCLNEECTLITSERAVKIPASCKYNSIHMDAVPASCHYNGNCEYWYCANCDVYYLDEECTIITSLKNDSYS
jgi:hypothetical protein